LTDNPSIITASTISGFFSIGQWYSGRIGRIRPKTQLFKISLITAKKRFNGLKV
jgi:hypothetical protein